MITKSKRRFLKIVFFFKTKDKKKKTSRTPNENVTWSDNKKQHPQPTFRGRPTTPEKGWTRLSTSKRERAKKRNFCVSLLRGCNFFFRLRPSPGPLNIKGKCRGRGINTGRGDLDFGFQRFVLQTFIGFFTFDQKCAEIASPRSRTRTKRRRTFRARAPNF